MIHTETCNCIDCENTETLSKMTYWVFWEDRGYMQKPLNFRKYEDALKFTKENSGFLKPYIIFGESKGVIQNFTKNEHTKKD